MSSLRQCVVHEVAVCSCLGTGGYVPGSHTCLQVAVEVLSVMRGEDETSAAFAGDNVKLKLKGIEEEVSSEGSIL